MCLVRVLRASRQRYKLAAMAAALVAVVVINAFAQIKLNAWQGSFFDALERRSFSALGDQLVAFLVIVGILLLLVVAQTWFQEIIKTRLREWLTHDLVDQWLTPKRAHRLADLGETGANPDQYIQADAKHLAETSATLAFGLLQSSLLLVSFVGVLWVLSNQVIFTYGDQSFTIPGYMVWSALLYAATGSLLTWRIGRPLVGLNTGKYQRESELRFAPDAPLEAMLLDAVCGYHIPVAIGLAFGHTDPMLSLPLEPSALGKPAEWESVWDPLFLSYIVNAPRTLADGAPHHLMARFRDVKVNPEFKDDQFKRDALTPD